MDTMTPSPSDLSIFSHNDEDELELEDSSDPSVSSSSSSSGDGAGTESHSENRVESKPAEEETNAKLSRELLDALYLGTGNFLLAYNTRAGIGVLMRVFKLLQRRKFSDIVDLTKLLDEKHLSFRVEAVSLGLFLGWFTGGYRALRAVLPRGLKALGVVPNDRVDEASTLLAGAGAAGALVFVDGTRRRSLALYALTRALQCAYNSAKRKNYWHFWGSHWEYGDSLLFALSSAQVMYAFIMRPKTLPPEYFRFIQKTGPVEKEVLEIVRQANRGMLLDPAFVDAFIAKKKMVLDFDIPRGCPDMVSCRMVHHQSTTCTMGTIETFRSAFVSAFPLYLSLFIVPSVVIHFKKFLARPFSTLTRAVLNASRSNSFVASFVALYMACICVQRKIMTKDHRFVYYLAGLGASASILIEPKNRRSELALYVLPRALDSLYIILRDRRIVSGVRHGEVLVFAVSMAIMMHTYEHEKDSMGSFLHSTLKRFLQSPTDKKKIFLSHLEQHKQQQQQRRDNRNAQPSAPSPEAETEVIEPSQEQA